MVPGRLKKFIANSAETIIAIVLVLAFFLIILGMLEKFFPSGTSFQDLMRRDGGSQAGAHSGERDLLVSAQGQDARLTDSKSVVAMLASTHNTVKSKDANAIAWRTAKSGTALRDRDAVQTFSGAEAVIQFDAENQLRISENSLVIIRRMESDPILRERRAFSLVVDGALSARLASSDEQAVQLEISTPTATTRIAPARDARGDTEVQIRVNPDQTTTLAVLSGIAELLADDGSSLRIETNEAATLGKKGAHIAPITLSKPPRLAAPPNGTQYVFRDLPPQVHLSWKKSDSSQYRLVLARNKDFTDIVLDETLPHPGFTHGNLKPGTYYWRVSGIKNWVEGKPSAVRSFRLRQDRQPPVLEVSFPPLVTEQALHQLSGRTEAGSTVMVDGTPIAIGADGSFAHPLQLQAGVNVIVVEAIDPAGNANFSSQLVTGRF